MKNGMSATGILQDVEYERVKTNQAACEKKYQYLFFIWPEIEQDQNDCRGKQIENQGSGSGKADFCRGECEKYQQCVDGDKAGQRNVGPECVGKPDIPAADKQQWTDKQKQGSQ